MLESLDLVFEFLHISVVIVNCLFWIIPGWPRLLFLIIFSLTLASWIGLGIFYGLGYCFLTDVHWEIKRELGYNKLPYSYIQHFIQENFNLYPLPYLTDLCVAIVFSVLLLIYIRLLFISFRSRR